MKATVPESTDTLRAQLALLAQGKQRRAVLVTTGADVPDHSFKTHNTGHGLFIFDPQRITVSEIEAASRENRIGNILGYGIAAKPTPGTETGVVVVRTPNGTEKQAVVTDAENHSAVTAAAVAASGPGDTVTVEQPSTVLAQRIRNGKFGSHFPRDLVK